MVLPSVGTKHLCLEGADAFYLQLGLHKPSEVTSGTAFVSQVFRELCDKHMHMQRHRQIHTHTYHSLSIFTSFGSFDLFFSSGIFPNVEYLFYLVD